METVGKRGAHDLAATAVTKRVINENKSRVLYQVLVLLILIV